MNHNLTDFFGCLLFTTLVFLVGCGMAGVAPGDVSWPFVLLGLPLGVVYGWARS